MMSDVSHSVRVEDCEHVQTAWLAAQARILGGESWQDGGLAWAQQPSSAYLLFPTEIGPDALARGLERIKPANVIVGAWLSTHVDATPLADAGFDRGWSPWWMTAPIREVGSSEDERVELKEDSSDYTGEYASYAENLLLTHVRPKDTWYAAAYAAPDRRFAGQAWSHLVGELAGVFDMAVWPPFRRHGLGTALLRAVCTAAGTAGARHAVLNATPDGKKLYETCGFSQIGEGITWWLHPAE
jgi:GNAT superfamily N-acetyltransferase